jgi:hypothetical protein
MATAPTQEHEFEGLPLRLAYPFLDANGLAAEAAEIRTSPARLGGYTSSIRRARIVALLRGKNLLDRFIEKNWKFALTPAGKRNSAFTITSVQDTRRLARPLPTPRPKTRPKLGRSSLSKNNSVTTSLKIWAFLKQAFHSGPWKTETPWSFNWTNKDGAGGLTYSLRTARGCQW